MKTRSRRYKNSLEHTDRNTDHDLENAISILSKQSVAKFDESVEISFSRVLIQSSHLKPLEVQLICLTEAVRIYKSPCFYRKR